MRVSKRLIHLAAIAAFTTISPLLLAQDAAEAAKEGLAAAKAEDWDTAVASFKKAVEADAKDATHRKNLITALVQRGARNIREEKCDEAIADLSEAITLDPENVDALRQRAFCHMRKNDWQKALADYNVVLKEIPTEEDPLSRRAFVHVQLKNYPEAVEDYSKLLKAKPNDVNALLGRSFAYEAQKKKDEALADIEKVLKLAPTNQDALGRQKRIMGRGQAAGPVDGPIQRQPVPPSTPRPAASPK
jgi:Flp pilus assembly protein TadD